MLKSDWRLLFFRLLLIIFLVMGVKITMREPTDQQSPEPPESTTTTTTISEPEWNEESLNKLIEQIAYEEDFENIYLLKQLAHHESRYLVYDKILDTNGYYSYGLFHFQLYTWIEQAELYNVIPKGTTLEQGRISIMNPELQLRTICRMDFSTIRQKWHNSWNKIFCS